MNLLIKQHFTKIVPSSDISLLIDSYKINLDQVNNINVFKDQYINKLDNSEYMVPWGYPKM
jgi:hypothetical protein